jgi:hypothetical protein
MTSALLTEIERISVERGARRMAYVLPDEEQFSEGLVNAGYLRKPEPGASTEDYMTALRDIRPTVTSGMRRDFDEDLEGFGRS